MHVLNLFIVHYLNKTLKSTKEKDISNKICHILNIYVSSKKLPTIYKKILLLFVLNIFLYRNAHKYYFYFPFSISCCFTTRSCTYCKDCSISYKAIFILTNKYIFADTLHQRFSVS